MRATETTMRKNLFTLGRRAACQLVEERDDLRIHGACIPSSHAGVKDGRVALGWRNGINEPAAVSDRNWTDRLP